eukprot:gene12426-13711_t
MLKSQNVSSYMLSLPGGDVGFCFMACTINTMYTQAGCCTITQPVIPVGSEEMDDNCYLNDEEESFVQDIINERENPSGFEIISSEIVESISGESSENISKQDSSIPSTGTYSHCQSGDLYDEIKVIEEAKCFSSVNQLKALVGNKFRESNCNSQIIEILHKMCGFCTKLEWFCGDGHRGIWYSSAFSASGLALNYIIEGALLLSGGQINHFRWFCNFVNIGNCCPSSFYQNQRLYVTTALDQEFNEL